MEEVCVQGVQFEYMAGYVSSITVGTWYNVFFAYSSETLLSSVFLLAELLTYVAGLPIKSVEERRM